MLLVMHSNAWNYLNVSKRRSLGLFTNVINKMYLPMIYI